MKGIIVIDGPDACGKTTLADTIKEYCAERNAPCLYQHAHYRFKDRMFQYHEAIVRKAINFSQRGLAVIDRLHWSEFVYGNVYRGGSNWPLQWRYFDRLLQKNATINIICTGMSPAEVAGWHKKARATREEMYDARMEEVTAHFINIYNARCARPDYVHYYWPSWTGNYGAPTPHEFVEHTMNQLETIRSEQLPEALKPSCYNLLGYVPTADVLFVGEKLNNKGRHQIWPFWEYKHSSLYLTQVLDELNFDETRAVWTNAIEEPNQMYLNDLIEYNKNLKVIALGNTAKEVLRTMGIPCKTIYHPSYAKRFNVSDYVDMVEEAIDAPTV